MKTLDKYDMMDLLKSKKQYNVLKSTSKFIYIEVKFGYLDYKEYKISHKNYKEAQKWLANI